MAHFFPISLLHWPTFSHPYIIMRNMRVWMICALVSNDSSLLLVIFLVLHCYPSKSQPSLDFSWRLQPRTDELNLNFSQWTEFSLIHDRIQIGQKLPQPVHLRLAVCSIPKFNIVFLHKPYPPGIIPGSYFRNVDHGTPSASPEYFDRNRFSGPTPDWLNHKPQDGHCPPGDSGACSILRTTDLRCPACVLAVTPAPL